MNDASSDIGRFAMIPEWVLLSGVSGNAIKCLGILLAKFVDRDSQEAWPSRKTMADLIDCSESSYDKFLGELKAIGVVEVCPRWDASGDRSSNLIRVYYTKRGVPAAEEGVYQSPGTPVPPNAEVTRINDPESLIQNHSHTQGKPTREKKIGPSPKTEITVEWIEEVRPYWTPLLLDFDNEVAYWLDRNYLNGTRDKRSYLLKKFKASSERHLSSGRKPNAPPASSHSNPGQPNGLEVFV